MNALLITGYIDGRYTPADMNRDADELPAIISELEESCSSIESSQLVINVFHREFSPDFAVKCK